MVGSFTCSCCSRPLLRHIRSSHIYWYCNRCHQEMPVLNDIAYYADHLHERQALNQLGDAKLLSLI